MGDIYVLEQILDVSYYTAFEILFVGSKDEVLEKANELIAKGNKFLTIEYFGPEKKGSMKYDNYGKEEWTYV